MPTFDQSLQQLPLGEVFFASIDQMPITQQSWQCLFSGEFPVNQAEYPALSQSSYLQRGMERAGRLGEVFFYLADFQPLILPPAHPITGRYPCSYPTYVKDFTRSGDRLRHIASIHQCSQAGQGSNFCPVVGCRRSYGRGLSRSDKVNDHLRKIHGLVRAASTASSTTSTSNNSVGGATANVNGAAGLSEKVN